GFPPRITHKIYLNFVGPDYAGMTRERVCPCGALDSRLRGNDERCEVRGPMRGNDERERA
ncbi:MAG: hypothetical protein IKV10_01720, partial [Alphaproteobacteria bacterium]|nr:hypothetical protein [Alphaproteobacteria bacterium]